ncbi:MAG TPA: flagellar export protein FliJ [Solirubrobacteraceae bacterium]|nr:flagellar export protein FliJ [Solirubrobacteraceae bacterium]
MTASFRFRLERVRVVRERTEKLAQRELADAISRRSGTVAELADADADVERALEEQRSALAVSGADLLARQAFLERTEAQRRVCAHELQLREVEVAERDAELASAASEHKMLERLSERRRGEHERELARRELGAMDEIAAARFTRSQA